MGCEFEHDEPSDGVEVEVEQAYIDFKPKSWKGVQIDVGEFVTSAGAEVIAARGPFEEGAERDHLAASPYR